MKKVLMILLGFVFITAISCGAMMMVEPTGSLLELDLHWLKGTMFKNYAIPGAALILTGLVNFIAWVMAKNNREKGLWWAMAAGIMMIVYEAVQIAMLQMTYWVQGVYIVIGFFIILISLQLKHKELI
jgi:hypothetical protein